MYPSAVASIEMAYARMRELQDQANRAHGDRPAAAERVAKTRGRRHKKR